MDTLHTEQPRGTNIFHYSLGHSPAELQRLAVQAEFHERLTKSLFIEAGISDGMCILDFGCGVGDMAFLAAQHVGERGRVIGVDRAEAAVQTARIRAAQRGLRNVEFYCCNEAGLEPFIPPRSLDAVVGRFVLCHQPNPTQSLRNLVTRLKPGGLIVFQEAQLAPGWNGAYPPSNILTQAWVWITAACACANMDLNMGLKLRSTFLEAGLQGPQITLSARVEGGSDSPVYEYLAQCVQTLLPFILKSNIATEAEVDIDTLAARLREEAEREHSELVMLMVAGGYASLPD